MTEPVAFKFIANQPNINQFCLQNQGPLQNQRTGPLKYTQNSLTNNPLQNQYSAKIIFKWPSENLLYKIKDLLSCYQSASKTSTFWTLKTDPTPPDFVEETGGGILLLSSRALSRIWAPCRASTVLCIISRAGQAICCAWWLPRCPSPLNSHKRVLCIPGIAPNLGVFNASNVSFHVVSTN